MATENGRSRFSGRFNFRTARPFDILTVQALLRDNGLPFEDIPGVLDSIVLGYVDDELVGVGGMEVLGRYGLLRSLVTSPAVRGAGYGKRLCRLLLEFAGDRGVEEIYLLTTTAERFFERLGFERVERGSAPALIQATSEFRELCPESAVCMRLSLR